MLWGKKQTKSIIHPSTSLGFLLFYFPKPRGQVWILIYRKWPIRRYPFILLSFSPKNTTQWPGQVSNPDLQTLTPASFSHWAKEVFKNSSSLFLAFLSFQYECGGLTVNTPKSGRKVFVWKLGGTYTVSCLKVSDFSQYTIYCLSPYESITGHLSTVREA